jgi:hypothetical protein
MVVDLFGGCLDLLCDQSSHFNRNVGNFLVHQQELNGTKDRRLTLYVWASEGGNRWEKDSWAHVDEPYKQRGGGLGELIRSILHRVLKLVGVILLVSAVVVAAAPSILSWPTGLKMALSLANHTIPGFLFHLLVGFSLVNELCDV